MTAATTQVTGESPAATGRCPVCWWKPADACDADGSAARTRVTCPRCGEYTIAEDDRGSLVAGVPASLGDEPHGDEWTARTPANDVAAAYPLERMHSVAGYLRELTVAGHGGGTVTAESARTMADAAPRTVTARTDRLLLNLAGMSGFVGEQCRLYGPRDCSLAYLRTGGELMFLLDHLVEDGLLDGEGYGDGKGPRIFNWVAVSLQGWTRVEALRSRSTSFDQAFVAMTFDRELEWIYTTAVEPAIRDAGYEPLILSRQEHADRVDERIVLELNRSRFVVAEFAQHRQSVYFEAGYALGRGLPVIWTCRAEDYEHAHFDTRQYNHIVWGSPEELRERLLTRIKVVVG